MRPLKILALLIGTSAPFSCQDDGTDEIKQNSSEEILLASTDLSTYQMVTIRVTNMLFQQGATYKGKIGNVNFEASYLSDSTIFFIVPENSPEGIQKLSFEFIVNSLQVSVLKTNVYGNISEYLNEYVTTLLNSISLQKGAGLLEEAEANSFMADVEIQQQAMETLTMEEKSRLAGLLIANQQAIDRLVQLIVEIENESNTGGKTSNDNYGIALQKDLIFVIQKGASQCG